MCECIHLTIPLCVFMNLCGVAHVCCVVVVVVLHCACVRACVVCVCSVCGVCMYVRVCGVGCVL